jgi:hypothetical protein
MATEYVVLRSEDIDLEPDEPWVAWRIVESGVEASNAEQACRRHAEKMNGTELEAGVTLVAVPARSWRTGQRTLRAETTRRIRAST